jgi:3-hydroxybutyryl-CoA dehydratase
MEPGIYWYEDLDVGMAYRTPGIMVTEAHVVGFAGLVGDFFPLHMDDEFARELGFEGRVAHGLLGLSMTDGLKNRSEVIIKSLASLGWNWRFVAPIFVGDRIEAQVVVGDKRETKKPDRGIVFLDCTVHNQDGEIVQQGQHQLMVRRRPPH